jgi:cold-inducible RNA-binding protein
VNENKEMGNRLYVGNLSFATTEDALRSTFAQCGEVAEVSLMLDRMSGRSRGFAFVTMGSTEAAQKAISQLNQTMLDGRPLKVNEAEERTNGGGSRGPRGAGGGQGGRRRESW